MVKMTLASWKDGPARQAIADFGEAWPLASGN